MKGPKLRRREVLGAGIAALALPPLARPIFAAADLQEEFAFTNRERRTLRAVADRLIPPFENDVFNGISAPRFPGAGQVGAVDYIETLLDAFNPKHPAPRIYAGGGDTAFIGSHDNPGECHGGHLANPDGWLPLPPEKELGWRRAIARFQAAYRYGIAQLDADARALYGTGFADVTPAQQTVLLTAWEGDGTAGRSGGVYASGAGEPALEPGTGMTGAHAERESFFNLVYVHCVEAVYGDPVYGGNRNRIGWKLVGFGGPRHPEGYFAEELETHAECQLGTPGNFGFVTGTVRPGGGS